MTSNPMQEYQDLMVKANDYHRKALWQEKLRVLQEALAMCEESDFVDVDERKQGLYYDVAGIWRRLGQYDRAEKMLHQSLDAFSGATSSFKASVLGKHPFVDL